MIKYIIIKYIPDGYGGNLSEEKIIRKSELKKYLDNGWVLHKKITPIITMFLDWWKPISLANKIAIIGILISTIIAVIFGVLAHLSDKENDSLKNENKTLNKNYIELKQNLILTADSLNTERKNSKNLLQKLKAKNVFK